MLNIIKRPQDVDVCILIEHVNREFESALLTKVYLERLGLSCEVVCYSYFKYENFWRLNPKLVIVHSCYRNGCLKTLIQFRMKRAPIIINLHSEQIVNSVRRDLIVGQDEAKDKIYHVSWGKVFTDSLIAAGVKPETIIKCGNPRLDFFKKGLVEQFVCTRESLADHYSLDVNKKWAMYSANTMHLRRIDEKPGNPHWPEAIEVGTKSFYKIVDWIEQFVKEVPDIEFIYRPHPGEFKIIEKLHKLKEQYPNFHIINEQPIRNWLYHCEFSGSWMSTSCVEASRFGRYMQVLRPFSVPDDIELDLLKGFDDFVENYKQFKERFTIETKVPDSLTELIANYYYNPELPACKVLADFAKERLEDEESIRPTVVMKRKITHKFKRLIEERIGRRFAVNDSPLVRFSKKGRQFKSNLEAKAVDFFTQKFVSEEYQEMKSKADKF